MDAYKKYLEKRDRWLQEHCPVYPKLVKCSAACTELRECFEEWRRKLLAAAGLKLEGGFTYVNRSTLGITNKEKEN